MFKFRLQGEGYVPVETASARSDAQNHPAVECEAELCIRQRRDWLFYRIPPRQVAWDISIMRYFSKNKLLQKALRQREQEFRALAENSPDTIMRYDRECRRIYVNPAFLKLAGRPSEEMLGSTPTDYSSMPESVAYKNVLLQVLKCGEEREHEYTWPASNDRVIISHFRIVPERDEDGSIVSVLAIGRDITERKRIEEALVAREQESRTLIENTLDTIARYDSKCRRIFANKAFIEMVEGGIFALLGSTPSECPGGSNAERYEMKIREVFATGKDDDFELNWKGKDGKEIFSHVRLTAERNQGGTIITVLAVGRDVTELNAYRKKIHQMAFYDPLTSLPNRALFNDRLRQVLADASWHGQLVGVMLLDLDRFKAINDTLGHMMGDELLREAAARLTSCVRVYDTVARLGGDEFAIILPEIHSSDDLGRIANKILNAFNEPFILESNEVFISTSVGIAVYPDDSSSADDLTNQSDSAMYLAKRSGRNNFRFYSKDLTASSCERLTLESELRRAVERNELELYYQPKVDLMDGGLVGSEALLRWNNPLRGMVPPDQFISIAEDSGLIIEIGEWVLRDACRTACDWNESGKPLHKVAINLSARQFQSNDLVKTVAEILKETGCNPEWIELEITESLLLDEHGEVLETLKAFQSLGISIAIDDFGTGYSALSYLTRFPINTLKIDQSFTRHITEKGYHAELVKAIISIARSINQQVVAEGVETSEQASILQGYGCHIAQGYLYSKAIKKSAFELLSLSFGNKATI